MTSTAPAPWYARIAARWPTALALTMSALTLGGSATVDGMRAFAEILPILPLLYVIVAKLENRRATWPTLIISLAGVVVLRGFDLLSPAIAIWAFALVVLVWSAVDGQLRRDGTFQLEAVGMLGFGALGLAGLVLDPDVGRYLVAAGWFLHGVWDFVHLKLDKVVARSFAEWCGVIDVVIAAELVLKL
ncbi:hypothetical protein E1262_05635 [Jiangella aurantiaca]|uniref:Uncharacterized protein n=1 Tax=Jiangella aurantiaca TaxID=2530373 RepID=A0A4R5AGQ8_9ACTN|nr:hypothetical protein [Jiangella aurantiaca]TDD71621.1 hypothetical protein E1262_05635 [Jiangella aurantiaca]